MRIHSTDIDTRLQVTLNKSIKVDESRGIMSFGDKNDYPEIMENLINGSKTGKAAAKIYAKFLTGLGFENENINEIVLGKDHRNKDFTVLDLLRQVSYSVAINQGAYIKVTPTISGQVAKVSFIPFKMCRFNAVDSTGNTSLIYVSNEWTKKKNDLKTKPIHYYVFNLNSEIIAEQIKKSGGLEKYEGQIYFHFLDNEYLYPLSTFDSVYLDLDSEQQMSIAQNRDLRNGCSKKTVMQIEPSGNDEEKENIINTVKSFMGPDGSSFIVMERNADPITGQIEKNGAFKIDQFDSNIEAEQFGNWKKETSNDIRKAANGLPAILIDYEEGKMSTTSGESIIQATNYYNALTSDSRKEISKIFREILSNSVIDELRNNKNWNIVPISIYENAKTNEVKQKRLDAQAMLRGSGIGVEKILQVQQSVKDGITTMESAIAILDEIYGIPEKKAIKILGNPLTAKINTDGSVIDIQ